MEALVEALLSIFACPSATWIAYLLKRLMACVVITRWLNPSPPVWQG